MHTSTVSELMNGKAWVDFCKSSFVEWLWCVAGEVGHTGFVAGKLFRSYIYEKVSKFILCFFHLGG